MDWGGEEDRGGEGGEKKGEEKKGREPRRPKRDAEVPLPLSVSL